MSAVTDTRQPSDAGSDGVGATSEDSSNPNSNSTAGRTAVVALSAIPSSVDTGAPKTNNTALPVPNTPSPKFEEKRTTIQWGRFTYEISQLFPQDLEELDGLWENYVENYKAILDKIAAQPNAKIRPGTQEFDLFATEKGIEVFLRTPSDAHSSEERATASSVQPIITINDPEAQKFAQALQNYALGPVQISLSLPPVQFKSGTTALDASFLVRIPIGCINPNNSCHLTAAITQMVTNPLLLKQVMTSLKNSTANPELKTVLLGNDKDENGILSRYIKTQKEITSSNSPIAPIDLTPLRDLLPKLGIIQEGEKDKQHDSNEILTRLLEKILPEPGEYQRWRISTKTAGAEPSTSEDPSNLRWPSTPPITFPKEEQSPDLTAALNGILNTSDLQSSSTYYKFAQFPESFSGSIARSQTDKKDTRDVQVALEYEMPATACFEQGNGSASRNYKLMSFDVHYGTFTTSGHYITFVRTIGVDEKGQDVDLYWKVNDRNVGQITEDEFRRAARQAYNFSYIREDKIAELRRETLITPMQQKSTATAKSPPQQHASSGQKSKPVQAGKTLLQTTTPINNVQVTVKTGSVLAQSDCDVIVNAANSTLNGGGGLDERMHKTFNSDKLKEGSHAAAKEKFGNQETCDTGRAVFVTNVPYRDINHQPQTCHIIQAVGPDGSKVTDQKEFQTLLENAILESLLEASKHNCTKIAFPFLSGEIYRGNHSREEVIACHMNAFRKFANNRIEPKNQLEIQFMMFLKDEEDAFEAWNKKNVDFFTAESTA